MMGPNECLTIGGGAKDKPCIFPFKYNGKTYTKCIWERGELTPWCSTKVTNHQIHVVNQGWWGYCNSYCPIPPKPGKNATIFIRQ